MGDKRKKNLPVSYIISKIEGTYNNQ
jgi:hypothetical protein